METQQKFEHFELSKSQNVRYTIANTIKIVVRVASEKIIVLKVYIKRDIS